MIRFIVLFVLSVLLFHCAAHYEMTEAARSVYSELDSFTFAQKIDLMPGTPYQTPAFIFDSGRKGASVFIIGGTHGNEPAGYEAALRLVERFSGHPPLNGKIILVPAANRMSIDAYKRRIPVPQGEDKEKGNLNRCYPGDANGLPMQQLAYEIEQLTRAHEVDAFIDLHEARYLHLNTPDESDRDMGLGQTIIYYPNIASTELVIPMLDGINETISDPDELFSAVEMPIKNSAAWWAGKYLDVAAFTLETTRVLELERRVNWHLDLVTIVLQSLEIWPADIAE